MGCGFGHDFLPVQSHQVLVGGDNMLAPGNCLQHIAFGGFDTAHHLNDHIYIGIGNNVRRFVG
ncbi:hypothetical protein D3C80_2105800 [compost metagenome]